MTLQTAQLVHFLKLIHTIPLLRNTHTHCISLGISQTHTHPICPLHPRHWNRQQREGHQRDNTIGKALQRVMINLCMCVCVCVCSCPKEQANGFISFCDSNDMEALWFHYKSMCVCPRTPKMRTEIGWSNALVIVSGRRAWKTHTHTHTHNHICPYSSAL